MDDQLIKIDIKMIKFKKLSDNKYTTWETAP
jgi:hypothetical protein